MKTSPGWTSSPKCSRTCRITVGNAPAGRQGQTLRDQLAVAVAERGRVVHRVADDRRVGAAHDDERHLVGDRGEAVLDHLERDRVDRDGGHRASSSMSMLPAVERARQPGGTTQVAVVFLDDQRPLPRRLEQRRARDHRDVDRAVLGPEVGTARRAASRGQNEARRAGRTGRRRSGRPRRQPEVDDVDRRVRGGVTVSAVVLGVEVRRDPAEVRRAGRDRQRQLVGLAGVAEVGEARDGDRVARDALRDQGARRPRLRARAKPACSTSGRRCRRGRAASARTRARSRRGAGPPR